MHHKKMTANPQVLPVGQGNCVLVYSGKTGKHRRPIANRRYETDQVPRIVDQCAWAETKVKERNEITLRFEGFKRPSSG